MLQNFWCAKNTLCVAANVVPQGSYLAKRRFRAALRECRRALIQSTVIRVLRWTRQLEASSLCGERVYRRIVSLTVSAHVYCIRHYTRTYGRARIGKRRSTSVPQHQVITVVTIFDKKQSWCLFKLWLWSAVPRAQSVQLNYASTLLWSFERQQWILRAFH